MKALLVLAGLLIFVLGAAVVELTTGPDPTTQAQGSSGRLWEAFLLLAGGALSAGTGWLVAFNLFQEQRRADANAIATLMMSELIEWLATLDKALEDGLDETGLKQIGRLPERSEVYRAVLPQLGILGSEIVGAAMTAKSAIDTLVHQVELLPSVPKPRQSAIIAGIAKHAPGYSEDIRRLIPTRIDQNP